MKIVRAFTLFCLCAVILALTAVMSCSKDESPPSCDRLNCGRGFCDTVSNTCVYRYCDTVNCPANSTCDPVSKTCKCNVGFEGADCSIMTRNRFMATFIGSNTCSHYGPYNDTLRISFSSAGFNWITIYEKAFYSAQWQCMVDGYSIHMGTQAAGSGSRGTSGEGKLSTDGHTLTMTFYEWNTTTIFDSCTFVGTKL
jgi:hypothetical protein